MNCLRFTRLGEKYANESLLSSFSPPSRKKKKKKEERTRSSSLLFLCYFFYKKEKAKEGETILEREVEIVRTQTHLSLSAIRYKDFTASTEACSANSEKTWPLLLVAAVEITRILYARCTIVFQEIFYNHNRVASTIHGTIYTRTLFSVTYRNARWRTLVYPVTGLFLSSAGATTDPGPRFRTRLIGDGGGKTRPTCRPGDVSRAL